MSYDNRIFNVNGRGDEQLLAALNLAFSQEGSSAKAWKSSKRHGLILLWHNGTDGTPFPSAMTAEECLPFIKAWLKSEDAKGVEMIGWDANADHDGDNGMGWRVYCEDWGHVDNSSSAICAVKPAMLWYGK